MHASSRNRGPTDADGRGTKYRNATQGDLKSEYMRHESVATALAGRHHDYRAAKARAEGVAKQAKLSNAAVSDLSEKEAAIAAELTKLETRRFRSKLFRNQTRASRVQLRKELSIAAESTMEAEADANRARIEASVAAERCNELREDARALRKAETARRHILENLFGGSAGSPRENELEQERNRLGKVLDRSRQTYKQQKHILDLLQGAMEDLLAARQYLGDARSTNTVDFIRSGPFSAFATIGGQYCLQNAAKRVRTAEQKIQQAVAKNRNLPIAKSANVRNGLLLGIGDVFFDGFFTDLVVRAAIEQSARSVERAMESLGGSVEFQSRNVNRAKQDVRNCSSGCRDVSRELLKARAELLHGDAERKSSGNLEQM